MKLRTIETPTDIYIVGTYLDERRDLQVTDDYSGFGVHSGDVEIASVECDGFGLVLTAEEMIQHREELEENNDDCGIFLIQNFQGDINIGITNEDAKGNITKVFDGLDLDDYLSFQKDCVDVIVQLPLNTTCTSLTWEQVDQSLIKQVRDNKIETIVK